MRLILRAMRQRNASDSMTHGPRMKSGSGPPRVQDWILSGLRFTDSVLAMGRRLEPIIGPCVGRRRRFPNSGRHAP